jgi:thioesterase domain-containing protein
MWKYVGDRLQFWYRHKGNYQDFLVDQLSENLSPHYLNVLSKNLQANEDYIAQVYPGVITLFRCKIQPLKFAKYPDSGWGDLVTGDLEIHHIPGDHYSLLREPRIQLLAEKFKVCLERSQANNS